MRSWASREARRCAPWKASATSPLEPDRESAEPIELIAQDPDRDLVALAKNGDQRAFEALIAMYQRRVARHVARHVEQAKDVEDVVQDTFIKAYRGLSAFKGQSAFYTWLYRIAKNCAGGSKKGGSNSSDRTRMGRLDRVCPVRQQSRRGLPRLESFRDP